MLINITNESTANITFNEMVKVAINGNDTYKVLWYYNGEFISEMLLPGGTWGAIPMDEVGNWVIEFRSDEDDSMVHKHELELNNMLIIYENTNLNLPNLAKEVKAHATDLVNRLDIDLHVFFKGSELVNFEGTRVKPLRLNDKINSFDMIYKKVL